MVQIDERGVTSEGASNGQMAALPAVPARKNALSHREGKWLLAMGDGLCLLVPLILAILATHPERPVSFNITELVTFFACVGLWVLLAASLNLYSLGRASSFVRTQRATIAAALVVLAGRAIYDNPNAEGALDRAFFGITAVLSFGLWRCLFAAFSKLVPFTKRVLVIGAGVSGGLLAVELHGKLVRKEMDYLMIGFVDDDPNKVGKVYGGFPVLGTSADMLDVVDKYQIDTVALAVNRVSVLSADIFSGLVALRERGVRIHSMPNLYETLTSRIAVEHVGDNWGIMFPMEHIRQPLIHDFMARALDVFAGIVGLLFTALLCPVVMIANKFFGSPGPLFYSQMRVGKGGKDFRIYKFRSMVTDAEKSGAKWCIEGDPRITKVGNFLRKTRIDELPQFWNVLKGEMSLIGPRPERPEFTTLLSESIPFFRARHAVKPGLTGWAQVMYRYGSSEEDSLIKLQYDLYYIKHRSPALDLRIIAKSFKTVLSAAGR